METRFSPNIYTGDCKVFFLLEFVCYHQSPAKIWSDFSYALFKICHKFPILSFFYGTEWTAENTFIIHFQSMLSTGPRPRAINIDIHRLSPESYVMFLVSKDNWNQSVLWAKSSRILLFDKKPFTKTTKYEKLPNCFRYNACFRASAHTPEQRNLLTITKIHSVQNGFLFFNRLKITYMELEPFINIPTARSYYIL